MATYAATLTACNIDYYETMAAAEKARLSIAKAHDGLVRGLGVMILWFPFSVVTRETEKLVSRLTLLETLPSSVLLEKEAEGIPTSLRVLFQKMCDVLQKANAQGLHESRVLGRSIARLEEFGQQIAAFADRFEDAQAKLRSRVPPEQLDHYMESLDAYRNSTLVPDQATDEDVKRQVLHF